MLVPVIATDCCADVAAFFNPSEAWFEYLKQTPDEGLDYWALSGNPNITWDIVTANLDKAWNYLTLSWNPNITWDIVIANPDKTWDFASLSGNLSITREPTQTKPGTKMDLA